MCGFCNVWVYVSVGFVMGGCEYVWVCVYVGVLTIVRVCSGNMCTCIYCVFVLYRLCIFILICY